LLRRNSVQELFNGYYFDYNLAALSQAQGFTNTAELFKAAANNSLIANNQVSSAKPPQSFTFAPQKEEPAHKQTAQSASSTPLNQVRSSQSTAQYTPNTQTRGSSKQASGSSYNSESQSKERRPNTGFISQQHTPLSMQHPSASS
jgi:hypothetical protein